MDTRSNDVMKAAAILLALLGASAVSAADRAPTRNQSYAAIAYYGPSSSVGWSTDRKSAREAKVEALKQCGNERCEVVASITRGCGALARSSADKFVVQKGATRNEAETKALRHCGPQCQVLAWACTR